MAMEIFMIFDLTQTLLQQVGNVKLISLVSHKLTGLTEPVLKASLHSVLVVFGQANNKRLEKQLTDIFTVPDDIREIKETLHKVVDQLSLLDANLTESVTKIVSEIKYQPLFKFFGEIESSMNEFEVLISSYGSHKVAFLRELDKFIDNYKAKNIEYKMVNYLDSTIPGSEPFIKIFIDKVLLMRNDNCCDINSSPVKFIYDFYVLIAMKVYEANNLLALCYAMKEKLTSESICEENHIYLRNRMESVADKLRISMKTALTPFNESKYLTSYLNLKAAYNDKPIVAVNADSKRRFYTGKIQVEREGYVVTGLRIRELFEMIFMQIQIGKLLPLGLIDQETVYWQELPKTPGDESTNNVKINLSCCAFDDSFLMGVKFTAKDDYVCLQFIRKQLEVVKYRTRNSELMLNDVEPNPNILEAGSRKHGYLVENSDRFKVSGEDSKTFINLRKFPKSQFFSKDNGPKAQHPFMRPFFDGTDVHFEPKVPLSGGGLMHYTNDDNHAGLIIPFLKTMKYKHINF